MKEQQALRLTEAIWECVNLGPGPVKSLASAQTRGLIEALRSAPLGRDVRAKLYEVERRFEGWFSDRDWRGDDEGVFFKLTLQTHISDLESCVETWFRSSTQTRMADYGGFELAMTETSECPYPHCGARIAYDRSELYTPGGTVVKGCPTCKKPVRLVMDEDGNVKASPA
jgi:hypothetical protein